MTGATPLPDRETRQRWADEGALRAEVRHWQAIHGEDTLPPETRLTKQQAVELGYLPRKPNKP